MLTDKIQTGQLVIDLRLRKVWQGDTDLDISGLTFTMLRTLVLADNQILSNDALVAEVWNNKVVSDETVAQRISLLRKSLGGEKNTYIESVRGEGYRWVQPVATVALDTSGSTTSHYSNTNKRLIVGMVAFLLVAMCHCNKIQTVICHPAEPIPKTVAVARYCLFVVVFQPFDQLKRKSWQV